MVIWRFLLPLFLTGCMSTTIVYDSNWDRNAKPAYVDYFDSYLGGFAKKNTINIAKVCMDQKPLALRRIKTLEDGFLTLITAGIYSPTTVKIWCGD